MSMYPVHSEQQKKHRQNWKMISGSLSATWPNTIYQCSNRSLETMTC